MAFRFLIETLLKSLFATLDRLDQVYATLMTCLKNLDPFFDLKSDMQLTEPIAKQELSKLGEEVSKFEALCLNLKEIYEDLSEQVQELQKETYFSKKMTESLAEQGHLVFWDLQRREEAATLFRNLLELFEQIADQQRASPAQKKKIEDAVFRLHLLERSGRI